VRPPLVPPPRPAYADHCALYPPARRRPRPPPLFLASHGDHRDLPSFPTRRSSDLDCSNVPPEFRDLEDGAIVRSPLTVEWNLGADRKSTRLNSSHVKISYAVFCLKKKKRHRRRSGVWRSSTAAHGCRRSRGASAIR